MQPLSSRSSSSLGMAVISFLFLGGLLPEYQAVAARPSADHVQRRASSTPIPRAACALPIHRDDLPAGGRGNRSRPTAEALPEPLRRQTRDHAGDAVMRGHAVVEPPELAQPVQFRVSELLDRLPTRCPADDRTDSQQHDIKQRVALIALQPADLQGTQNISRLADIRDSSSGFSQSCRNSPPKRNYMRARPVP